MRFVPSLRLEIALNIKYISILFLYSVLCIFFMFRTEVELHYIQTIMSVQGAMDISEEDHY